MTSATLTIKTKVAMVRAKLKTIRTADVDVSAQLAQQRR